MPPNPQPLPDTHTHTALEPTAITPGAQLEPAAREAMVWVPGPGNGFIAVPRSLLPADYFTPPAPATTTAPVPAGFRAGFDPRAQVLGAGGVGAGAAAWGMSELVDAIAGLGTAGLLAIALAVLAARMPRRTAGALTGTSGGQGTGEHTEIHIHKGGRLRARHVHIR